MGALLLAALLLAAPARAGTWTREDARTLRFDGDIEQDEYRRFAEKFDDQVRELVIGTSNGGSTEAGVRIGLALAARDLKVTVTGPCLSSCANYLFTAGRRREIRGGIVGFHGDIKACDTPELRAADEADLRRRGAGDAEIRAELERKRAAEAEEQRFLRMIGVDQALFDRSCTPDKGLGDGKVYSFFLPTNATFERYGVRGVEGEQDRGMIEDARRANAPLAVD